MPNSNENDLYIFINTTPTLGLYQGAVVQAQSRTSGDDTWVIHNWFNPQVVNVRATTSHDRRKHCCCCCD